MNGSNHNHLIEQVDDSNAGNDARFNDLMQAYIASVGTQIVNEIQKDLICDMIGKFSSSYRPVGGA